MTEDLTTPVLLCSATPVVLFKYYPVLQSTTLPQSTAPVLLHYKVPLQYYSPLQSNYYSSAALSYKVLLQHYKVLLQHYAEYYRVLLQYYPVLHRVLLQYYCVLQSATPVAWGSAGVRAPERRGTGTPALPRAGVPVPRRSETSEKRLLMCKTQQLIVPEPDAQQSIAAPPGRAQSRDRDLPLTERSRCMDVEKVEKTQPGPQSKRNKKDWGNLGPHPVSMREALGSIPIAAVVHCGVWLCSVSAYSRTIKSWTLERALIPVHQQPRGPWVWYFLLPSGFLCSGAEGPTQVHR